MAAPLSRRVLRISGWATLVVSALLTAALAAAAQPPDQSSLQDSHPLQEVQVTASKLDRRTLKLVAIQFVKLHGAVSPVIHQIGRWQEDVCPRVTGLKPAATALVSRRVEEIARSVGAPARGVGRRCTVNVEIVFTPEPQQLLNHIAKAYPVLLGSSQSAGDTIFRDAVQSWYLTGTREMNGWNPTNVSMGTPDPATSAAAKSLSPDITQGFVTGLRVDPADGRGYAPTGLAGSYLTKGLTSEFLHVLVIVDARKVAGESLPSISDYVAMLVLTRMSSLDGCNELPSIIDLLSSGCGERDRPQALTDADTAYLRALYSLDLEMNLNIELGDMRDRMVMSIRGR